MEDPRKAVTRVIVATTIALVSVSLPPPAQAHTMDDYRKQRGHLEERARSQIGTPYSYGGSSPSGFDCSGFTRWVFMDHGASLPHSSDQQWAMGDRPGHNRIWDRSKLEVGDLVFHDTDGGRVGHVGIYVGNGRFISSTSSEGVQVRSIYDPYYWGPRWVGAVRLPVTRGDDGRRGAGVLPLVPGTFG